MYRSTSPRSVTATGRARGRGLCHRLSFRSLKASERSHAALRRRTYLRSCRLSESDAPRALRRRCGVCDFRGSFTARKANCIMDWRNRIGLYGSYFFGVAGIGFTLPYLPLYLGQEGLSDRAIGLVSTLAALAGLAQFPVGLWSDRIGTRKPFLIASLGILTLATGLLHGAHHMVWLAVLVPKQV